MEKIKIIIATNSYIIQKGLDLILREMGDFELIWENFEEEPNLLDYINNSNANFVFLSPGIIKENDLGEFSVIFNKSTYPKLILISDDLITNSLPEFYIEYIHLEYTKDEITNKLKQIFKTYLPDKKNEKKSSELSDREKNIVRHIALGNTNKEIGEKLFISTHTVITHRKNITQKLGIKTVSGLTVYAILNNIIIMEEISKQGKIKPESP